MRHTRTEVVERARDEFQRVHREALETFAGLTDEWFGRRERSREWPADFAGHSAAHRTKDIEAALVPRGRTKR